MRLFLSLDEQPKGAYKQYTRSGIGLRTGMFLLP